MNLIGIENSIKTLEENVASLKGKVDLLETQYNSSTDKLDELKKEQVLNSKSVELLNIIQKATKEVIQDLFQDTVSKALQFVHQNDDYTFELEFSRHGNVPKMSFLLKTSDMQESHEIVHTRAGGSKDIVSLALRLVLLEVSQNKGFLFLDEPFKRLDNEETTQKAIEFLQEIQKETGRQLFIITHKQDVIDSVNNIITSHLVVEDNIAIKEMDMLKIKHDDIFLGMAIDMKKLDITNVYFNNIVGELDFFNENKEKFKLLTKREREILLCICKCKTNFEIGQELFISQSTVETHRKRIIKKLSARNSLDLIHYARVFDTQKS